MNLKRLLSIIKRRHIGRRGFDVIRQEFFAEELGENRVILHWFSDFEEYYDYVGGKIYKNACYYQCDLASYTKRKIDLKKNDGKYDQSLKTMDDYAVDPIEIANSVFRQSERIKEQCQKWDTKYKKCDTVEGLGLLEEQVRKDGLYRQMRLMTGAAEELREFSDCHWQLHNRFFLWRYLNSAEHDINKMRVALEFFSRNTIMTKELCALFGQDKVIAIYDLAKVSKATGRKIKTVGKCFREGRVISKKKAFFDWCCGYYCEETEYEFTDENVKKRPGMTGFSVYRLFESFEEFVTYRNGDLTNTDLSFDMGLRDDLSKYKVDETTKLPKRNKDVQCVIEKRYHPSQGFYVSQIWFDMDGNRIERAYHSFPVFYDFVYFLKGDLSNSDLFECEGLKNLRDIAGLSFKNASIKSCICEKLGIPYDVYELDKLKIFSFEKTLENEKESELVLNSNRKLEIDRDIKLENNTELPIYYITDLHISHKLKDMDIKSETDRLYAIQKIIAHIMKDILLDDSGRGILLIGGDVASDYDNFVLFVKTMKKYVMSRKNLSILFTLGNHELWDFEGCDLKTVIQTYRELISDSGMYLLQNDMLYIDSDWKMNQITAKELVECEKVDLKKRIQDARFIFFGGLAFAGYNESFNANIGLYRGTITREVEIEETKRFESLYNKVVTSIPEKEVIVLTHMPMECWRSKVEYQCGYVYVSGHTHRNVFFDDGEIRIYADNQVGYKSPHAAPKFFYMESNNDYFSDYTDGIYQISNVEYIRFYRGKNLDIAFNRETYKLYMLKKNGYYCFLHESRSGSLCILNGGRFKRINETEVQQVYDHMDEVIDKIKQPMDKYTKVQEKIANEIRKIGGEGRIHGTIIDIDYFNHIYVNPIDMRVTGYWARDIYYKKVYPIIPLLLQDKCPELFANYEKLIGASGREELAILNNGKDEKDLMNLPQFYLDTDIYKVSREIKKMQKLYYGILTTWF